VKMSENHEIDEIDENHEIDKNQGIMMCFMNLF